MQTHEIRRRFPDHFESAGHTVVPSASLIADDPTLLFVNAGMVPFKPYFLGEAPPPYPRATSVQKCVRTGDIERSARPPGTTPSSRWPATSPSATTSRQGPSSYAWELLTEPLDDGGYGLDPDRLWVTVYETDDEAMRLWQEIAGVPPERIQRRGMADNFWSMGVPGPCGPVLGDLLRPRARSTASRAARSPTRTATWRSGTWSSCRTCAASGPARTTSRSSASCPSKNIDTGLGVERIASLLQGVDNVYETDLLRPIIDRAEELSGAPYGGDRDDDVRLRVIADHARTAVMLIGDGVTPGQRGPRLRAAPDDAPHRPRARLLGVTEPVLGALAE